MSTLLPILLNITALQGQAVEVIVAHEPGLTGAEIEWDGRTVPFVRDGSNWFTVIGIDLDEDPGEHAAPIRLTFAEGTTETRAEQVSIEHKSFPTTELTVEPRYVELNARDQERANRESGEIAAVYARLTPERLWTENFVVPLPGIEGGRNFGHRRVFNGQPRAPHSGADLSATTGTPIHASNRGRVVLAKELFFSGNAVFLDHGLGVYSTYLHLSEIGVEVGDLIERGDVIGLAGATGRVTGPHLHWGVRVLDARVDPFSLLTLGAADVDANASD